jgi:HAD superfamily hydrolase (TIGR01509 family)
MIGGLIFDFDGLMVDTESPAYASWLDIYREYGCELPLSLWQAVLGGSGKEFDPCAYLEQQVGRSLDCAAIGARRWQRKLELVAAQPLLPGVRDYISAAKRRQLKLAVASSSSRTWVVGHLDRLGVADQFDAIITADNVTHVKPDPEIYQAALAALALPPEQAIAIEDAPNGLLSARRAGIVSVAVPNPLTGQLPIEADLRLVSLADVPLDALLQTVQTHERTRASGLAPRAEKI